MELRHLRYFVALAEELHFTRAAERLNIEQSPLSRIIRDLEEELGALLFDRDRRGTRLTPAGEVFLGDVRRLLGSLDQACASVKAVAAGFRGSLRIAVSDGVVDPRLSAFLARCRIEEPEIEIRLIEVPLAEQVRGLRSGDFHLGFAHVGDVGKDIFAEPLWRDSLVLAMPAVHPLLEHAVVPLDAVAPFRLLLCDPRACEGCSRELNRLLNSANCDWNVIAHVSSMDMMLTLVAAGYGVGFAVAAKAAACTQTDVVFRPLAIETAVFTTYMLWLESETIPPAVARFTARLHAHLEDG